MDNRFKPDMKGTRQTSTSPVGWWWVLGELERGGGQACILSSNSKDFLLPLWHRECCSKCTTDLLWHFSCSSVKVVWKAYLVLNKENIPYLFFKRTQLLPEPRLCGFVHYKGTDLSGKPHQDGFDQFVYGCMFVWEISLLSEEQIGCWHLSNPCSSLSTSLLDPTLIRIPCPALDWCAHFQQGAQLGGGKPAEQGLCWVCDSSSSIHALSTI